jgi:hypothetical protein
MSKRLTANFCPRYSEERGVALILTLAIIALVTLLLIAFVTSMRVENAASKNFNDLIKTRELALGAVDQAVAKIRQGTAERTASPVFTYATSAGVIYNNTAGTIASISLSSPTNPAYSGVLLTNNLNDGFWITGSNNVEYTDPGASAIPVGWVYVLQDPSAAAGPANPVIGRYAYWVDDEASKININTAFQRPATLPDTIGYSTNSEIDLTTLVPLLNTASVTIQGRQSPTGPGFTTIEEVKLADLSGNAFTVLTNFNANRFYLTTYSNDGNYTNYTDDLDVFDRQRLVVSTLQDPSDIVGAGASNAFTRMSDNALKQVYSSSGAFDAKYTPNGVKQIIANIIAYQHDPASNAPPDSGDSPPTYLGLGRTPYINEVQVNYNLTIPAPDTTNVTQTVSVELFYMYNNGTYTSAPDSLIISNLPAVATLPLTVTAVVPSTTFSNGTILVCVATNGPVPVTLASLPIPAGTIDVTYSRPSGRLDFSRITLPVGATLGGSVSNSIQGAEANDPAVNDTPAQWNSYPPGPGSLGAINSTTYTGNVTKAVIRAAPMKSIGELGYIHTSNPWQHLHLQPQPPAEKPAIPDWAILDMFTVGGSTAGRININSTVSPLSAGRLIPLKALLNNVTPTTTIAKRDALVDAINSGTYANTDTFGNPTAYDTIGEICEVTGMDNGATTDDAAKEEIIRRIANIITVRSSTFTVWVMAQSIKQPPTSTIGTYNPTFDLITGEVRAQAVVERYENPPGSAPKFRTRYFRYLYN